MENDYVLMSDGTFPNKIHSIALLRMVGRGGGREVYYVLWYCVYSVDQLSLF